MISGILFAFAKELGFGYQDILDMPFPIFRMYAQELSEYLKAKQAASEGKRHQRALAPLTKEEKARRTELILQERDRLANKSVLQRPKRVRRNVRRGSPKGAPGAPIGTIGHGKTRSWRSKAGRSEV